LCASICFIKLWSDWASFIPSDLPIVTTYDNIAIHIFVVLSVELSFSQVRVLSVESAKITQLKKRESPCYVSFILLYTLLFNTLKLL
jgi:hypothetical protein